MMLPPSWEYSLPGTADYEYLNAVDQVMRRGTRKPNRTGVDTISTFGLHYRIDLSNGFPLLLSKKIKWEHIVLEMLWFLSGRTDIEILQRFGIKFWDPWADEEGRVPSAYGNYWRHFPAHGGDGTRPQKPLVPESFNDQIAWVINELKNNPMSRRLVVSAWYPGNAQTSKLPPCHCMYIFNVQNDVDGQMKLNLHLTQRSCDMALGIPYNIASYAFLLHLVARFTGMDVGTFSHTLVDAHIYTSKEDGSMTEYDHIPGLRELMGREVKHEYPVLHISDQIQGLRDIEALIDETDKSVIMQHFQLEGYQPHGPIKFKVAV